MTARSIAGWTALGSGVLLVVAIAASLLGGGPGGTPGASAVDWMMGGGGTADAMGQRMGRALAGRVGQPISPADASTLGNATPDGATVDRAANRITFDTATVRLAVLASPADGPDMTFRIAGLADPTIVVPRGAIVTVQLVNADSDTSHGWLLTAGQPEVRMMAMMDPAAFRGAVARPLGDPTAAGLPSETVTFTAEAAGPYTYLCPVPGHAEQGMYGTLEVTGP
ncbi:MAG: sulfocyanin-like copper-binding protein [Candidatus Limnocylindria bacterium]